MNNQQNSPATSLKDLDCEEVTGFNHRGWRAALTFFASIISGTHLTAGPGFFVEMALLSAPLSLDYFRYRYHSLWRQRINTLQKSLALSVLVGSFLGILQIFNIVSIHQVLFLEIQKGYPIGTGIRWPIKPLWQAIIGILIALTIVDWVISDSPKTQREIAEADEINRRYLFSEKEPTADG